VSDPPTPERFVADADVLAVDLLLGGAAREAVDLARGHSWVALVATDPLLDDAEAVIGECADPALATDWREKITELADIVDQPAGDHPGLAAAYHGGATQLLSYDEGLRSAKTGATLRKYVDVSVRTPAAFVNLFDPESIYEVAVGGAYPGPDRDPRA
jgi:hypothetical protein